MLQSVQSEVGELGRFRMAVDGDHAAFFVELVEHGFVYRAPSLDVRASSKRAQCHSGSNRSCTVRFRIVDRVLDA